MPRPSVTTLLEAGESRPNPWVTALRDFTRTRGAMPNLPKAPVMPDLKTRDRLWESTREEVKELWTALQDGNLVEAADGIIDSIYTLIQMGLVMGLPLEALFNEVHISNMEKRPAAFPGARKTAEGEPMKPPGWERPRLDQIIAAASHKCTPAPNQPGLYCACGKRIHDLSIGTGPKL